MRYAEYKPIAYVENVSTSAFLEEPAQSEIYQRIVNKLAGLALDEGESREMITSLAT